MALSNSGGNREITVVVKSNITSFTAGMTAVRTQLAGLQSSVAGTLNGMSSGLAGISNQLILTGAAGTGFSQYISRMFSDALPVVEEYYKSQSKLLSLSDELKNGTKDYNTVMKETFDITKKFSEQSIYSMTEVSDAMYTLGQAGFKTNDILAVTPHLLNLATAQGADLKTTVEDMIGVINAYDVEMQDVWRVTNLFAAAATASRVSMEDVHYGIKFITPTFSELEYSIETAVTAWTMLTDLGYKGENAGRILRDSMNDLMNPTAEATEIIRKYNLQLYDNQDEYNQLSSAYQAASAEATEWKAVQAGLSDQMAEHQRHTEELNLEMQRLNLEAEKVRLKYSEDNPMLKNLEHEKDVLVESRDAAKDYYNSLRDEQQARVMEMTVQKSGITDLRRQISEINNEMAANRSEGFEASSPKQQALAEQKKELQDQLLDEQRSLDEMKKSHTENAGLINKQKIVVREASEALQDQNKKISKTKDELKDKEQEELTAIEKKKIAIEEEKLAQAEKLQVLQDKQREVNKEVDAFTEKTQKAKSALGGFVPTGLRDLRDILQEFKNSGMLLGEYGIIFGKQSAGGFKKLVDNVNTPDRGYDDRMAELIKGEGSGQYDAYGNYIGPANQMGEADRQKGLIMQSPYGQFNLAEKQLGANATLQSFQNNIQGVQDTLGQLNTPKFRADIEDIKTNLIGGALEGMQTMIPHIQDAAGYVSNMNDETVKAAGALTMMTGIIMYAVSPALLTLGVFGSMLSMLTGGLGRAITPKATKKILKGATTGRGKVSLKRAGMWLGDGAGGAIGPGIPRSLKPVGDVEGKMSHLPQIAPKGAKRDASGKFISAAEHTAIYADAVPAQLIRDFAGVEKAAAKAAPEVEAVATKTGLFARIAQTATAFLGLQGLAGSTAAAGTAAGAAAGSTGLLAGLWGASVPLIGGVTIALGPLVVIIGAVIAAIGLLWFAWKNNWGNIQGHFENLKEWFFRNFGGLITLFNEIKDEFGRTFGQLLEDFQKVWDGLANADLTELVEGLGGIVGGVARILGLIPYYAQKITYELVESLISGFIDGAPNFVMALWQFIIDLPKMIEGAVQVAAFQFVWFGQSILDGLFGVKRSEEDKNRMQAYLGNLMDAGFRTLGQFGIGSGESNLYSYAANEQVKRANRRLEDAQKDAKKAAEELTRTTQSGIDSNDKLGTTLDDLSESSADSTAAAYDVSAMMDKYKGMELADFNDLYGKQDAARMSTQNLTTDVGNLNTEANKQLLTPNYDPARFDSYNQQLVNTTRLLNGMNGAAGAQAAAALTPAPVITPAAAPAPVVDVVKPSTPITGTAPTAPTVGNPKYVNPQDPVTGIGTYNDAALIDGARKQKAGFGLGAVIAAGMMTGFNPLAIAATAGAQLIASFFPQSPAKQGPLTKLPEMGKNISQQLADGIRNGIAAIEQISADLAQKVADGIDPAPAADAGQSVLDKYRDHLTGTMALLDEFVKKTLDANEAIALVGKQNAAALVKAQNTAQQIIVGGQTAVDGYITAPDGTKMKLQAPTELAPGTPMSYRENKIPDITQQAISHNDLIKYYQGASSPRNENFQFTFNGTQNKGELTQFGKRLVKKVNSGRGNFRPLEG